MLFPKKKEDNVVGVIQQAIRVLKVKVTQTTIRYYLYRHPYYPTLKSVCDALDKWKIENYALDLSLEEMQNLNQPFIAHRNIASGQIILVYQIDKSGVQYSTGDSTLIKEDIQTFSETLSGAVIVFQQTEHSGQEDFSSSRQNEILDSLIVPFSITGALLLLAGIATSGWKIDLTSFWKLSALLFTKVFGLIVSLLLVLHELKVRNPFVDKICHISKHTDCNAVLDSDSSKIFGWINWADFGFIYFLGGLFFIIINSGRGAIDLLALISVFSIPFPLYSIYTQAFRIKKFCSLCLTVQFILIAEFAILLPEVLGISISASSVIILMTCYGLPGLIYLLVRSVSKVRTEYLDLRKKYFRFKSNPQVFRNALLSKERFLEKPIPDRIILGNPDGDITIHAFLSLYCHPCSLAFDSLLNLLRNSQEVKINIILIGKSESVTYSLLQEVQNLQSLGRIKEMQEQLKEWYHMLKINASIKSTIKSVNQTNDSILLGNLELFKEHNISGTPTILVENFAYPKGYIISDLEFYIDDIRQLIIEKKKAGGYIAL